MWWAGVSETEYCVKLASYKESQDYVAVGFSSAAGMGPAPVVACNAQDEQGPIINWNKGSIFSDPISNHSSMVESFEVSSSDGSISCSFILKSQFEFFPSGSDSVSFDLNMNPSYVIMGTGPVTDGKLSRHAARGRTTDLTDLTKNNKFITTQENISCNSTYLADPSSLAGSLLLPEGCQASLEGNSGIKYYGNIHLTYLTLLALRL